MSKVFIVLFFALLIFPFCSLAQELTTKIKSAYQADSTTIRSVHTTITDAAVLNLIFVLPVEAAKQKYRFGSGLEECRKLIDSSLIADDVVFIQPDYMHVPWYGNHPNDTTQWQLAYTVELIKNIQSHYPNKRLKTYLLGFSKSGFGSMNILLKYPELTDGIMIWDAPLATQWNEKWQMHFAFGSEKHFMENGYLMRENGQDFDVLKNKEIVVGGYDLFADLSSKFLEELDEHGIAYSHDNSLNVEHAWNKDWVYDLLAHIDGLVKPQ